MKFIKKISEHIKEADRIVASKICAALSMTASRMSEYENRFEPEPPEPDPMETLSRSLIQAGFSSSEAAESLLALAKAMNHEPNQMRKQTNNWRKMHGLPMRRKTLEMRRRNR